MHVFYAPSLFIKTGCGLKENKYVGAVCPVFFWTGNDSGYG